MKLRSVALEESAFPRKGVSCTETVSAGLTVPDSSLVGDDLFCVGSGRWHVARADFFKDQQRNQTNRRERASRRME